MNAWFGKEGSDYALPHGKPCVCLYSSAALSESDARAIGVGCEEEGVPLSWCVNEGSLSADELSRAACLASRLEVGIGVDDSGEAAIALVHVSDAPYIRGRGRDITSLRWLGQAASRMSKGEPLPDERAKAEPPAKKAEREMPAFLPTSQPPGSSAEINIASIVRSVLNELGKNTFTEGVDGHEPR